MVGHGGSSAGSYLADPTSPIPSHSASIVMTSTLRVKGEMTQYKSVIHVINCNNMEPLYVTFYLHVYL